MLAGTPKFLSCNNIALGRVQRLARECTWTLKVRVCSRGPPVMVRHGGSSGQPGGAMPAERGHERALDGDLDAKGFRPASWPENGCWWTLATVHCGSEAIPYIHALRHLPKVLAPVACSPTARRRWERPPPAAPNGMEAARPGLGFGYGT